ncbi:MAG: Na+/H+ antiporter NhaC family protein [Synechococcales cyanobacterium C42_A2020_086]|jgi:NhaC family Na+:H+ antiporter|nr:Na+/H+ antiporter NhaC family protein [Synechococcales cyanobacterium C42_A2020_086]
MDLLLACALSFGLLLFSVVKGYFMAYPLLGTLGILVLVLRRRGFPLTHLLHLGLQGSRKALPVFTILLLIGAVTAVWMAAGTVPAIVYYGIQSIHPNWFIITSFGLTGVVSLLIGTSFGAAGTIGVALMIMARGSEVDPHLIAGAIIAGAYVGDRCSPLSSSAHLIANLTQTDLYRNLKNMMVTGVLPLLLTGGLYLILSRLHPVPLSNSTLTQELARFFDLQGVVLLPAGVILVLAGLRIEAKQSMLISLAVAAGLAMGYQHYSFGQVLQFAGLGFYLDAESPIQSIMFGGGVLAMAKVCSIVLLSTTIAGILAGTHALHPLQGVLTARSRRSVFLSTTLVSLVASAFGCTQTISILLTEQLVRQNYQPPTHSEQLALDLENTAVVLAPLVPWNIAGLVPATVLSVDWQFIPYAFYLYLIPFCVLACLGLPASLKRLRVPQQSRN